MDSILNSIKKLLGISEEYTQFDADIIIHINSVFGILTQLGIGPPAGFSILDNSTNWSEFIGDATTIEMVKTYIYLKTKLIFDPPQNSSVTASIEKTISELEWRLSILGTEVSDVQS